MSTPRTRLRILLLEDSQSDARLALSELERAGYEPEWTRVETEEDYEAALDPALDLILADYSLPQFDAPSALDALNARGLDIPFIVVTGTVSEEHAVECMRHGAADYLIKDRFGRLGQAVARALEARAARAERELAIDRLRESELRYRSLIETAASVVLDLAPDGTIRDVNPEGERVLDRVRGDLIGRSYFDFVPEPLRERSQSRLRRVLEGEQLIGVEGLVVTPSGDVRTVLWNLTRRLDAHGRVLGAVGVGQDITSSKELEEQFRQSQKMEAVGRLAGGVAHDFNNLLTVIQGYSDLALRHLRPGDPLLTSLEQIRSASERAASLTRQLLAFSRKQVLSPKVVNLNAHLEDLAKMLRRLIGEDVELVLELATDSGHVLVDPGQMEQVIINLAVNARDAMPDGGRLCLATRNHTITGNTEGLVVPVPPGEYVVLSVADTGSGMDTETVAQIFEPFFTTKGPDRGTGLGLSTVYGIVEQSGGRIRVESKLGVGTVFEIFLPVVESRAEPRATEGPIVPRAQGESVLVVEDDVSVRRLVCTSLEMAGYRVLEAVNGEEALRAIEAASSELDLIITDVIMPKMNGRELLDRVRERWPSIPVLLMSGYTDRLVDTVDLADTGMDILFKPFSPDTLTRAVRGVLERRSWV